VFMVTPKPKWQDFWAFIIPQLAQSSNKLTRKS